MISNTFHGIFCFTAESILSLLIVLLMSSMLPSIGNLKSCLFWKGEIQEAVDSTNDANIPCLITPLETV